jgi:CheY-like chemotaxis protein
VRRTAAERALSILLVEDHPDTARALSRLLRGNGHQVVVVESVGTAIQAVSENEFDVIVSDIGLPDGTGIDLIREVRRRHGEKMRAVALSGFGMEEDVAKCRDAGFDDHLTKPVNLQKLEATIQRTAAKGDRVASDV